MSLARLLDEAAGAPGESGLVGAAATLPWAAVREAVAARAGGLAAAGLGPDDAVGVQHRNTVDGVIDLLAVCWLGAALVPLHPSWAAAWRDRALDAAGARAWVGEGEAPAGRLHPTGSGAPAPAAPAHRVVLFTSGSTGPPKPVLHRGESLSACARLVAELQALQPADRALGLLPFAFHYGLTQLTSALAAGSTCVLQRAALPAAVLDRCATERVTVLAGVPATWGPLAAVQGAAPRELSALRLLTNAGGRPGPALLRDLQGLLPGARILRYYGQTEVLRSTWIPAERATPDDAIGRAVPGVTVAVVDEAGRAVPAGVEGELVHGGAFLPARVGAATPQPLPALGGALGWRTGDRCVADEDGTLRFIGRADGLLKVGGFRVGPGPIEAALEAAPGVLRAAVVLAPDPLRGEALVAAVQGAPLDPAALRRWCRDRLPAYMVPARILPWTRPWPTTPTGKTDRLALAAALTEETP